MSRETRRHRWALILSGMGALLLNITVSFRWDIRHHSRSKATGSAIGIHGPKKGFERWGRLNSRVNWTHGCIAVATHREIEEIENWFVTGCTQIHLVND